MKLLYSTVIILAIIFCGCKSSNLVGPSTGSIVKRINYSVPQNSMVKLTVENNYNSIMETPVDKEQNAGVYSVSVDMSNYSEGIYFYTLEFKGVNSSFYYKVTTALLLVIK